MGVPKRIQFVYSARSAKNISYGTESHTTYFILRTDIIIPNVTLVYFSMRLCIAVGHVKLHM